tara:strand:- start:83 stop:424 length:342 start_codon:yes stop_codon:yes gene_type:complete
MKETYFIISYVMFGLMLFILIRSLTLALYSDKNFKERGVQLFKVIIAVLKGILQAIFLRRVYYNPNSENSLKFDYFFKKQLTWIGGGNQKLGTFIYFLFIVIMIVSFILGIFS